MQFMPLGDVVELMQMEYAEMPDLKLQTGAAAVEPARGVVRTRVGVAHWIRVSHVDSVRFLRPPRRCGAVSPGTVGDGL